MHTITLQTVDFMFEGDVPFGTTVGQMRGRLYPSEEFSATVNGDPVSDEFILRPDDVIVLSRKP